MPCIEIAKIVYMIQKFIMLYISEQVPHLFGWVSVAFGSKSQHEIEDIVSFICMNILGIYIITCGIQNCDHVSSIFGHNLTTS